MDVKFEFRNMTDKEFKREQEAFNEQNVEHGDPPDEQERFGFVATEKEKFVGASSGLAQKEGDHYQKYFYLSDLLVEKEYKNRGYGKKLLSLLEDKIKSLGMEYIWTWTAYEAETFYVKQGYEVFVRFKKYFPSGHDRVGLIKKL